MRTAGVLITGASSGIGRTCALHLAQSGYRVFAGVRDLAKAPAAERIIPLRLDVTQTEDWARVSSEIQHMQGPGGLTALINNAGIGLGGPAAYVAIERFQMQFDVNYYGAIRGVQACLPLLKTAAPSYILNLSSVNGQTATPFLSPYCSSKFALEAYTECLRYELKPFGIHAVLIQPGVIRTPIFEKSEAYLQELKEELPAQALQDYGKWLQIFEDLLERVPRRGAPPERVARTMAKVLISPKPRLRYPVGRDAYITLWMRKYLPASVYEQVVERFGI